MRMEIGMRRRSALLGLSAYGLGGSLGWTKGNYPERSIRMVVGHAGGSGADIVARLVANGLAAQFGSGAYVENRSGAGGVIGAQDVIRSAADGYTLFMGAMPEMLLNYVANAKYPFDPFKDFQPVAQVVTADLVLITNPNQVKAKTLKELMDWSAQQPAVFFGTPGPGTVAHFMAGIFGGLAGAAVDPVHFKATAESVNALLNGSVQALFVTYPVAKSLAQAGRVRVFGVSSPQRTPLFPDTPTFRELGYPDLLATSWYGVFASAKTPPEIVKLISAKVLEVTHQPDSRSKLEGAGLTVTGIGPSEFGQVMRQDRDKWTKAVQLSKFRSV